MRRRRRLERSARSSNLSDTRELAERIAKIMSDKLARDIVILDMRAVVSYTDWFVIGTGGTARQTKAIYDEISFKLKHDDGLLPTRAEGHREGDWILLDYLDAVVHLFTPEARDFYRLEHLWGQVPAVAYAS